MRAILIASLLATQAAPAVAAPRLDLTREEDQVGAFVGARLRIPLGAERARREPLLGLSIGPSRHGAGGNAGRVAFGEGVALDVASGRPELRLGGARLKALRVADDEEEEADDGDFPDEIAIAGGVLLLLAAGYTAFALAVSANSE